MGNTNYATVGNAETLDIFEEYSNDNVRIKQNSNKHKEDSIYDTIQSLKKGDIYGGVLVSTSDREYIFDVGYKTYVNMTINSNEMQYIADMQIGDYNKLMIVDIVDGLQYNIYGSVAAAKEIIIRHKLRNLENDIVMAYIKEMTPSGYNATFNVDGMVLNAFMPHILAGANKILDVNRDKLVGEELEVCLEGYSSEKNTYIINRKERLKRLAPEKIKSLRKDVLYKGYVTGVSDFKIFVELEECLTGVIYRSYLLDKDAILTEGMEIEFYVKDAFRDKIVLRQVLVESMWDSIKVNDVVEGTVKSITMNGVLVSIDEETYGMIRKSDCLIDYKNYMVGAKVSTKIINIDNINRKIFLTDK